MIFVPTFSSKLNLIKSLLTIDALSSATTLSHCELKEFVRSRLDIMSES